MNVDLDRLERHFYTSSSCGVCGKASLDAVAVQGRFDITGNEFEIDAATLGSLPAALRSDQAVFEETGGLHASGLFDAGGGIVAVREDVGRHNARDKLIGSRLQVGAPSSLEVELANEFGITLVGFLRPERFNIYSRPERIAG